MQEYPYTTTPGKLGALLDKIRKVGVPKRADKSWLRSIGFTSRNDPNMLAIIKQIAFVDESGVPTEDWKRYRGLKHAEVLARALKGKYKGLYATYPKANQCDDGELESFFSSETTNGIRVVKLMRVTFRVLCEKAGFSVPHGSREPAQTEAPAAARKRPAPPSEHALPRNRAFTVNVNIQLTLPETTDPNIYENLFAAMRKHLPLPERRDD